MGSTEIISLFQTVSGLIEIISKVSDGSAATETANS